MKKTNDLQEAFEAWYGGDIEGESPRTDSHKQIVFARWQAFQAGAEYMQNRAVEVVECQDTTRDAANAIMIAKRDGKRNLYNYAKAAQAEIVKKLEEMG